MRLQLNIDKRCGQFKLETPYGEEIEGVEKIEFTETEQYKPTRVVVTFTVERIQASLGIDCEYSEEMKAKEGVNRLQACRQLVRDIPE